jgi:hypothetical protein
MADHLFPNFLNDPNEVSGETASLESIAPITSMISIAPAEAEHA